MAFISTVFLTIEVIFWLNEFFQATAWGKHKGQERDRLCDDAHLLQEGKYKRAALQYKKIVSWLEHESGLSTEEETKSKSLRLAAHLNLSMCHLKLKEYSQALENCNKVVRISLFLTCTSNITALSLALTVSGIEGHVVFVFFSSWIVLNMQCEL